MEIEQNILKDENIYKQFKDLEAKGQHREAKAFLSFQANLFGIHEENLKQYMTGIIKFITSVYYPKVLLRRGHNATGKSYQYCSFCTVFILI